MSLITTIEPLNATHAEVRQVLQRIQPPSELGLELSPEKRFFGLLKRRPLISLSGVHGFLTDDADWNAPFWSFHPQGAQKLADFLLKFSEVFKKDFVFASIWAGDDVGPDTKRKNISADKIAEATRTNRLETKTFYKVMST